MAGKKFTRRHVLMAAITAGGVALGQVVYSGLSKMGLLAGRAISPLFLPFISRDAITNTPTNAPTATRTPLATNTPTPTKMATATGTPTSTKVPTATVTNTSTVTTIPATTAAPTQTATSAPTNTPSPMPTTPPSGKPRVVHVFDAQATHWDYATGYYGDYVNQSIVNAMVDTGVMSLTGTSTVTQAWQQLLSAVSPYSPGKRIVIKVNLNNSNGCNTSDNDSDALIQPVNAVIRGLQSTGVQLSDIWVIDPSRVFPARLINGCPYKNQIHFLDKNGSADCGGVVVEKGTWSSSDPHATIQFNAAGLASQRLSDALIGATYFINMPILRAHGITGVTLGFKHLMGCIPMPINLHDYIGSPGVSANPNTHPWVDIFQNPHVRGKLILTLGDGLYGQTQSNTEAPDVWDTFQNYLGTQAPNSLFFGVDPVATDSVMADIIRAETPWRVSDWALHYLQVAEVAKLGVFEKGSPWGTGYSQLDYVRLLL